MTIIDVLFYEMSGFLPYHSEQEVEGLARMLGIESCLNAFPGRLSGGQQQRVAIARALIHHPQIILADEPTGNLDSRNAAEILNIFSYLNQCGTTILMVTHNPNIAAMCQRRFLVSDGCCSKRFVKYLFLFIDVFILKNK